MIRPQIHAGGAVVFSWVAKLAQLHAKQFFFIAGTGSACQEQQYRDLDV